MTKKYIKIEDPTLQAAIEKLDTVEVRKMKDFSPIFNRCVQQETDLVQKIARECIEYALELSEPGEWPFSEFTYDVSGSVHRGKIKRDIFYIYMRSYVYGKVIGDDDNDIYEKMRAFIRPKFPLHGIKSEVWAEVKGDENEEFINEQLILKKLTD